jgi:hypothetical protein
MITILVWVVFVVGVINNVATLAVFFEQMFGTPKNRLKWNFTNISQTVFIFAMMFVPGVYLFGLW